MVCFVLLQSDNESLKSELGLLKGETERERDVLRARQSSWCPSPAIFSDPLTHTHTLSLSLPFTPSLARFVSVFLSLPPSLSL